MKAIKQFPTGTGLITLVILLFLAFLVGCNKENGLSGSEDDNPVNAQLKKAVIHQGSVSMTGFTRFEVYAIKAHRVIVYPDQMFLICEAELTFGEDQSFVLHTKEFMPGTPPLMLYREATFHGKISNGGQVKFAWPESWWELGETAYDLISRINLHTGYVVAGQGVNKNTVIFNGNYDGEHFNADFRVKAFQEKPGIFPAYQEVVDGPIMFSISIELEKVNP